MATKRNGELGFVTFHTGAADLRQRDASADALSNPAIKENVVATEEDMKKSMDAAKSKEQRKPKSSIAPPKPLNVAKAINPSAHQQAAKQVKVKDEFDYEVAMRFGFLGAGQGGSRIANAFWDLGYRRVGAFNTTDSDFDGLAEEMPKYSLNIGGASKDPELARGYMKQKDPELWDLMQRSWGNELDYALVCVGLGGGTGSGASTGLVEVARKYMADKGLATRVGAIVSLPTISEGQKVCRNAVLAFRDLLKLKVSPLIVIDNALIAELYRPGMLNLHPTANSTIASLFHLFNQMAAVHSRLITFDRSEFAQLLDGGVVVMGAANFDVDEIRSPADISSRIRDELAQNVLARVDLAKGRKAACLFVGSEEVLNAFSLDYFDAGFTQLDRIVGGGNTDANNPTVVHRGIYVGDEDGLQCYTMISELQPPVARLNELARKAGLTEANGPSSSMAKFLGVDG